MYIYLFIYGFIYVCMHLHFITFFLACLHLYFYQESESSEEEDMSEENLEETEGWKLLKKAIDLKCQNI